MLCLIRGEKNESALIKILPFDNMDQVDYIELSPKNDHIGDPFMTCPHCRHNC